VVLDNDNKQPPKARKGRLALIFAFGLGLVGLLVRSIYYFGENFLR